MAHKNRLSRRVLPLLLAALFCLSGCTFGLSASVEDLMKAPLFSKEQQAIIQALDRGTRGEIKLIYPKEGAYRTPVDLFDINSDGTEEALAFYTEKDKVNVHLAVLQLQQYGDGESEWNIVFDQEGRGNQIGFVRFDHISHLSYYNILVGWNVFGESNNSLAIYGYQQGEDGEHIVEFMSREYEQFVCEDMDGDYFSELVFLSASRTEEGVKASVYKDVGRSAVEKVTEQTLDPRIVAVRKLEAGEGESGKLLYIDGLTKENLLATEVLAYQNGVLSLVQQEAVVSQSQRQKTELYSQDIDRDEKVEVPIFTADKKASLVQMRPASGYQVDWYEVGEKRFVYDRTTYENEVYKFRLTLPTQWQTGVTFESNLDNTVITCKRGDAVRFSILRLPRDESAQSYQSSGFEKIGSSGNYIYYCKPQEDSNRESILNVVKSGFSILN